MTCGANDPGKGHRTAVPLGMPVRGKCRGSANEPGEPMTEAEATALLAAAFRKIAPEVDLSAIDPGLPLQETADIDSMDFLALLTVIHDRAGIEIPPRDYPRLATLKLFVSYLTSALRPGSRPGPDA